MLQLDILIVSDDQNRVDYDVQYKNNCYQHQMLSVIDGPVHLDIVPEQPANQRDANHVDRPNEIGLLAECLLRLDSDCLRSIDILSPDLILWQAVDHLQQDVLGDHLLDLMNNRDREEETGERIVDEVDHVPVPVPKGK